MENKLQQLTDKLYEEGLSRGRAEAEKLLADAHAGAEKILSEARREAANIKENAIREAEETRRKSMAEIALAGRQAVGALRDGIANMIVARTLSDSVHKAAIDPAFIRELLLAVASHWNSGASGKVSLSALLPAARQAQFEKEFEGSVRELLKEGVEISYSDKVKSGFKIGEKGGGYYIGFSEADLDALLGEFLKERVAKILYAGK